MILSIFGLWAKSILWSAALPVKMLLAFPWQMSSLTQGRQWQMSSLTQGRQWQMSSLTQGRQWQMSRLMQGRQWQMSSFSISLQCFVYDHSAYAAGVWSTPTFVQVSVTIYSYLYAVSDSSPRASWSQWYWHGRNLQQCFNRHQSLDFVVYLDPWTNSFVSEV